MNLDKDLNVYNFFRSSTYFQLWFMEEEMKGKK